MSAPQIDLTFQACAKHGIPIERGAACAECVREDPAPAAGWPDIAVQRMVVYVYEGAVAKDRPEIMWYVGGWDDHLRHARSISRKSLGGNPAPGYYLVSIAADGYAVLAYETEDQRAKRLAKGGGDAKAQD